LGKNYFFFLPAFFFALPAFAFFFAAIANLLILEFGSQDFASPSVEALSGENLPSPPQLPINVADSTAEATSKSRADRCFGKKILKWDLSDSGRITSIEYRSVRFGVESSRTFYRNVASLPAFG
jgi:hypothetical protein